MKRHHKIGLLIGAVVVYEVVAYMWNAGYFSKVLGICSTTTLPFDLITSIQCKTAGGSSSC